ncbi:MAG: hypothetical protein ABIH68_02375 [bacterium]
MKKGDGYYFSIVWKMPLPSGDAYVRGLALGSLRARVNLLAHTAPSDNGHFHGIIKVEELNEE